MKRKTPLTSWPADFELDGDMHRYAQEAGIAFDLIHEVWERFANYHQAKGSLFASWPAAWRFWVQNELKFSRERRQIGRGSTVAPRFDPIEHARKRIQQLSTVEQEDMFWPNRIN